MRATIRFIHTLASSFKNSERLAFPQEFALVSAFAGTIAAALSYFLIPVRIYTLSIVLCGFAVASCAAAVLLKQKNGGFPVYTVLFFLLCAYALYRYAPDFFPFGERVRLSLKVTSYPVFRRNAFSFDARVLRIETPDKAPAEETLSGGRKGSRRFFDKSSRRLSGKGGLSSGGRRDDGHREESGVGMPGNRGYPGYFAPMTGLVPVKKVSARVGSFGSGIKRGDTLGLNGMFFALLDEGFGSYGRYLRSTGAGAIFEAYAAGGVVQKRPFMLSPVMLSGMMKNYILQVNRKTLPYPQNEFATALITGDRSSLPRYMTDAFRKSGTMHILAVSGLHIGYLVIFLFFILRLFRLNRVATYALLGIFVLFFMIFVGERASVRRAACMTLCGIFCYIFDRDKNYLNALALAFCILWLINPLSIENPGFLLSFCAVFGILFIAGPIYRVIRVHMPGFLAGSIAASAAVQVYIFPVMTAFFREFPYINIIANVPIVPLAGVSLALEASALILYPVIPPASLLLSEVNTVVIATMFRLARLFAGVPPITIPHFPAALVPLYLLTVTLLLLPIVQKGKGPDTRVQAI